MKQIKFYTINPKTGIKEADERVHLKVNRLAKFKIRGLNLEPLKDEGSIKIKFLGLTIFDFTLKKGDLYGKQ